MRQRYRRRGIFHGSNQDRLAYGDRLDMELRPFEVIVLEIGSELSTTGWNPLTPNRLIDSSSLRVEAQEVAPEAVSTSVDLPPASASIIGWSTEPGHSRRTLASRHRRAARPGVGPGE